MLPLKNWYGIGISPEFGARARGKIVQPSLGIYKVKTSIPVIKISNLTYEKLVPEAEKFDYLNR
jgi:hypothetical protein